MQGAGRGGRREVGEEQCTIDFRRSRSDSSSLFWHRTASAPTTHSNVVDRPASRDVPSSLHPLRSLSSLSSLLYRYLHDSTQSAIGFRPSSSSATSPERRKLYGNLRTCVRTAVWRLAKETYDLGQRAVEAGERERERERERPTRRTTKGTCLCTWQRQRMEKRERKRENNNRERKVETKMEQSTRLAVGPSIS